MHTRTLLAHLLMALVFVVLCLPTVARAEPNVSWEGLWPVFLLLGGFWLFVAGILLTHPWWLPPILALPIVCLLPGVPGERPRQRRAFIGAFLAAWPVFWLTELLVLPQRLGLPFPQAFRSLTIGFLDLGGPSAAFVHVAKIAALSMLLQICLGVGLALWARR